MTGASGAALARALSGASYEILPFKGIEDTVQRHVPREVPLSVTVTQAKGLDRTLEVSLRLAAAGYQVSPHLAARLVRDAAHLDEVVTRLESGGVTGLFVIGGDADRPAGVFTDALGLLQALQERGHGFASVGIGGYPEGHGSIPDPVVQQALRDKSSCAQYVVTQLCFDPAATRSWSERLRRDGVQLPVRVGVPGVVNRQRLVRIAGGLGLGPSARFLRKQNGMLARFFLPGGYHPDRLVKGLAEQGDALAGLHVFTFNELEATEHWRRAWLARLPPPLRQEG